mgnify:CR=1 FL=1
MFTNDTLEGRTALITGGGTGIGLEIATLYAQLGASVMLIGRNEERVRTAADTINAAGGRAAALRLRRFVRSASAKRVSRADFSS